MVFYILFILLVLLNCEARGGLSKWMEMNYDRIKKFTMMDITVPGTHNSGSVENELNSNLIHGSSYYWTEFQNYAKKVNKSELLTQQQFEDKFLFWNINQDRNIAEQLSSGIRFFHLKLCSFAFSPASLQLDSVYHCHRGFTGKTLLSSLIDIKDFIGKNPKEIVMIGMDNFDGNFDQTLALALAKKLSEYFNDILILEGEIKTKTIEELVNDNHRIAIFLGPSIPTYPSGILASSKYIYQNWDDEMEGGDIKAGMKWLQKDMLEYGSRRDRLYILQANPNQLETNMYDALLSGQKTALYDYLLPFYLQLPQVINNTLSQYPNITINSINMDYINISRLNEFILLYIPPPSQNEVTVSKCSDSAKYAATALAVILGSTWIVGAIFYFWRGKEKMAKLSDYDDSPASSRSGTL